MLSFSPFIYFCQTCRFPSQQFFESQISSRVNKKLYYREKKNTTKKEKLKNMGVGAHINIILYIH